VDLHFAGMQGTLVATNLNFKYLSSKIPFFALKYFEKYIALEYFIKNHVFLILTVIKKSKNLKNDNNKK